MTDGRGTREWERVESLINDVGIGCILDVLIYYYSVFMVGDPSPEKDKVLSHLKNARAWNKRNKERLAREIIELEEQADD